MSCYTSYKLHCYSLLSPVSDCLSQQYFTLTKILPSRALCSNISNSWILFNACQFWWCVVYTPLIINSCHLAIIKISFDKSWYSVWSMIMPFWLSYGYGTHFAFYGHWNSDMELRWGAVGAVRALTSRLQCEPVAWRWDVRVSPCPPVSPLLSSDGPDLPSASRLAPAVLWLVRSVRAGDSCDWLRARWHGTVLVTCHPPPPALAVSLFTLEILN